MTEPQTRALPWNFVGPWLEDWAITPAKEDGEPPEILTSAGPAKVSWSDIEDLIAAEDPVAWGWLNLRERESVQNEEGETVMHSGDPWNLFPVQAKLARFHGNLIVECGAEVGKTRDIVLGTLWEMDTKNGSSLIAADSDITLQEIWSEIEFQLGENPDIGMGVIDTRIKPYREKVFRNGNRFQMRLCGFDGKQFRGAHVSLSVRADEVTKWKYWQQLNELWRSGKPGVQFRMYSTPDGDYSSPFYEMCARAIPIDGRATGRGAKKSALASSDEPRFRKINIRKQELPPPFWTEARAAKLREQYGGEQSIGWLTNVEGKWGSPNYSVFPAQTLKSVLRDGNDLPHYRIATATIDTEKRVLYLNAARLSSKGETEDGAHREEILAREVLVIDSTRSLAQAIAQQFPEEVRKWQAPLYCGVDPGSAKDPTEVIFVQVVDKDWIDVFRLHLRYAEWPEQATIFAWLDHASGHRAKYGFDNGAGGSGLVQMLTLMEEYSRCPSCQTAVYFAERVTAFGFGDNTDEIDVETGEVAMSSAKKDAQGNPTPNRISRKEYSTRLLERKMQAWELRIANDGGAGNQSLAGPQLMINHTVKTVNGRRHFRELDDHHVDARRQAALSIVQDLYGSRFIDASPEVMATSGRRVMLDSFAVEGMNTRDFGMDGRAFVGVDW